MKPSLCTPTACQIGAVQSTALQTGDIISRRARIPIFRHFGVVVIEGGEINVWHNSPSHGGVVKWTLEEWQEGIEIESIHGNVNLTATAIETKVQPVLDRRFNFASWNCEHFITFLEDQPLQSRQVANTVGAMLGLYLLWRN